MSREQALIERTGLKPAPSADEVRRGIETLSTYFAQPEVNHPPRYPNGERPLNPEVEQMLDSFAQETTP